MGFVNDKSEKPWKTIDRERNITLINQKIRVDDAVREFTLDIDGEKYFFLARRGDKYVDGQENLDVTWEVLEINPKSEFDERLRAIIQEALGAFGTYYRTEKVTNLNVEFLI